MLQHILNCPSANSMRFLFSATTDTAVHSELSKSQVHDLPLFQSQQTKQYILNSPSTDQIHDIPFSSHSRQSSISWTVQAPTKSMVFPFPATADKAVYPEQSKHQPSPWSFPFQPQQTKQYILNSPSTKSMFFPFPATADKAEHPGQSKHRPSPWSFPLQPHQTKQNILNCLRARSMIFPFPATETKAVHPERSKHPVHGLPLFRHSSTSWTVQAPTMSMIFPFTSTADKAVHPERSKHPVHGLPFSDTAVHPEQSKRQVRDLPKMKDTSYSVSVICFVRGCWQLLSLTKIPTTKKGTHVFWTSSKRI